MPRKPCSFDKGFIWWTNVFYPCTWIYLHSPQQVYVKLRYRGFWTPIRRSSFSEPLVAHTWYDVSVAGKYFLQRFKKPNPLFASFDTLDTYSVQRTWFYILMPKRSRATDSSSLVPSKEKDVMNTFFVR